LLVFHSIGLFFTVGAGAAEPPWNQLVERYAPAVVSLGVTLRTEMEGTGGSPEETTAEISGIVVDPSGLILCWNSNFSAGRMAELFGDFGSTARMKVQPTEIKVRIGGNDPELPAFLAASDSDLDLAFVQLEEKPAQPLVAVDFARPGKVALGDALAAVSRLSSAFGHAPYFDVVRVTGEVKKPRAGWILGGGNATAVGMPYFAADGAPAGVLVTVLSRSKSATTPNPTKLMADLLSLGRGQSEAGPLGLFLIPAERVRPVVEQAKKRAAELLAERGAAPAATN
jgi:hypothetical protein